MRMATIHQLRPSEEPRHKINKGYLEWLADRDEEYIEQQQALIKTNDGWFGDNPKVNPSLIDKLSPWIMGAGLIAFVMLCTWLIEVVL